MATPDPTLALSVPGQLALAPTQNGLLTPFPCGGQSLGLVVDFHVEQVEVSERILSEGRSRTVGRIRGDTAWFVGFKLLQYDLDALNLFYRTVTTSSAGYANAGTIRESHSGLVPPALPLCFVPDDPTHPAVYVYAPVPYLPDRRRLDYAIDLGLEWDLVFEATEDATSGAVLAIGRLETLNLNGS